MVILASHLPGEGWFTSRKFHVTPLECHGDYGYVRGWQEWWETPHTLISVEHDMDARDEHIIDLLTCPHPLCTVAYLLHPVTTGRATHYAQRRGHKPPAGGEWIGEGEPWCDFTGIGLCKLVPQARVRPLGESTWQTVDCEVSKATEGRWHVHWTPPCVHHHVA